MILGMTEPQNKDDRGRQRPTTIAGAESGQQPFEVPPFDIPAALPRGGGPDESQSGGSSSGGSSSGGIPSGKPDPTGDEPVAGESGFEVQGVYIISVAARILDMHPQTLRKYERLGLITPVRTVGMLRLYSQGDIRKILLIRHLMDNLGLNLAGVEFALALVENLGEMQRRAEELPGDNPARTFIGQQIAQLCRNLSLPPPGWTPEAAPPQ
jgi:MerR family transcriptional regulator/heat shock protein HspR